jgi:hypothetical protein
VSAQEDRSGTLFRGDSLQARILSALGLAVGKSFLRQTLRAPIENILQRPLSWEVNPNSVSSDQELQANLSAIAEVAQMFIDSILYSFQALPGYV